jgi:methylated-DNA-[protein]-cysteine S-methyltransferase
MELETTLMKTPVGTLQISGSSRGIRSVMYLETDEPDSNVPVSLQECVNQVNEYFSGVRKVFNLKLDPAGTDFQLKVWEQLLYIPYGKTISYLDLALMTGSATNTRAVGNANGKNKINIIVPCHRVIGSNGKLTGYGGGLWRKDFLLKFELGDSLPGLFA